MSRVTSKLQVTIPKAVAEQYGISPGTDIQWLPAGDAIRVTTEPGPPGDDSNVERRLELFDRATERRDARLAESAPRTGGDRGWTREELYTRGGAR